MPIGLAGHDFPIALCLVRRWWGSFADMDKHLNAFIPPGCTCLKEVCSQGRRDNFLAVFAKEQPKSTQQRQAGARSQSDVPHFPISYIEPVFAA